MYRLVDRAEWSNLSNSLVKNSIMRKPPILIYECPEQISITDLGFRDLFDWVGCLKFEYSYIQFDTTENSRKRYYLAVIKLEVKSEQTINKT